MLSVTKLARRCNLSRTTVLYYEREGLLLPAYRTDNGYRWYGDAEIQRLKEISAFRSYGIPVGSIKELLDKQCGSSQSQILKEYFYQLEDEIHKLKERQRVIVTFF